MKLAKTLVTFAMSLLVALTTVFIYDAAIPKMSSFSPQMDVEHGAPIEPEEAKALVGVGLASKPSVMDPAKPLKPTKPTPPVQDTLVNSPPPSTTPPVPNGAQEATSGAPEGGSPASPTMTSEPQSITTKEVTNKPSADVSASTSTPNAAVSSKASTAVTPSGMSSSSSTVSSVVIQK